jgi:hypothetical protein
MSLTNNNTIRTKEKDFCSYSQIYVQAVNKSSNHFQLSLKNLQVFLPFIHYKANMDFCARKFF